MCNLVSLVCWSPGHSHRAIRKGHNYNILYQRLDYDSHMYTCMHLHTRVIASAHTHTHTHTHREDKAQSHSCVTDTLASIATHSATFSVPGWNPMHKALQVMHRLEVWCTGPALCIMINTAKRKSFSMLQYLSIYLSDCSEVLIKFL